MKIKTDELIDKALDWAVTKCVGAKAAPIKSGGPVHLFQEVGFAPLPYCPSTDWAQGGPIIDELIQQGFTHEKADFGLGIKFWRVVDGEPQFARGPTTLVAAMRCYVVSKLGDEVDVPEELI